MAENETADITVGIRFPKELLATVDAASRQELLTRSAWLRRAAAAQLRRVEARS